MTTGAIQPLAPARATQTTLRDRTSGVLMPNETVLAVAACTEFARWWFLPPHGVVVTDHRVLVVKLGLFGGMNFQDFHWEHVQDVHLSVGMMSALVRITAAASKSGMQTHAVATGTRTLTSDSLAKDEAQAVYRIGQQMEQTWRERQRARYMEEQRVGYATPFVAASISSPGAAPGDVASRVAQLNSLKDQGLITQSEYDARKAEIIRSI